MAERMLLVISRFEVLPGRRAALEDWLRRVEECNHALMAPLLRVDGQPDLLFTLARYRDKAHRDEWTADERRKRLVEELPSIAQATKQVYEAELIEDELIGFGPGRAANETDGGGQSHGDTSIG